MKFLGKSFLVVAFMVSLLFMAGNAGAAIIAEFNITDGNTALKDGGFTGPYATVKVDLDSGGQIATIYFTAMGSYLMGDGSAAALNLIGAYGTDFSYKVGSFTSATGSFDSVQAPHNVSDFGNFDFAIKMFDGYTSATSSLSFQLEKSTGSWTNATDFFDISSKYLAGSHIFPPGGAVTGFASGNGGTGAIPVVPVPPTVWLLGAGLVGLWGVRRRFLKK
jgi:hypothetical protein